ALCLRRCQLEAAEPVLSGVRRCVAKALSPLLRLPCAASRWPCCCCAAWAKAPGQHSGALPPRLPRCASAAAAASVCIAGAEADTPAHRKRGALAATRRASTTLRRPTAARACGWAPPRSARNLGLGWHAQHAACNEPADD
ncbi:hypothetical protein JKP88DRAFT_266037, partial [Tribonema minus]